MWYLSFECAPQPGTQYAEKYAGAKLLCFIRADDQTEAERQAKARLTKDGWIVKTLEEAKSYAASDDVPPNLVPIFEMAQLAGAGFMAITWQKEAASRSSSGCLLMLVLLASGGTAGVFWLFT